jgi:hypothetical protein
MRFSEADAPWQPIPSWADYLLRCGLIWAASSTRRRVGIISMPCESAGAGLVALGALRHRLTSADANDAISHYERIERLAARFECETYVQNASMRGRFRLEGRDERGWVWARREQKGTTNDWTQSGPPRISIHPSSANQWRLEREAPSEAILGERLPYGTFYEELVDGAPAVLVSNLTRSDSAVCLAGRAAGESMSRSAFSSIRFECGSEVTDLSSLLTVHRWSPGTVSRLAFFNSRTRQLDRNTGFISLVVADGDSAFLRAIDTAEFRQSDIIGVIDRAVDRDRLESIGTKLGDLSQWYAPDVAMLDRISPPPGITVSVLQRRQE